MKRWSMSNEWVTEPTLTSVTRLIDAASGLSMVSVVAGSVTAVAALMVGRAARVPSPLNR